MNESSPSMRKTIPPSPQRNKPQRNRSRLFPRLPFTLLVVSTQLEEAGEYARRMPDDDTRQSPCKEKAKKAAENRRRRWYTNRASPRLFTLANNTLQLVADVLPLLVFSLQGLVEGATLFHLGFRLRQLLRLLLLRALLQRTKISVLGA
jgi:hypothetical protein